MLTILIFNKASLQSSNRYLAFLLYIRTTPRRSCPLSRKAIGAVLVSVMASTLDGTFVCRMWDFESLRSMLADNQTRAKGPVLERSVSE